MAASSSSSTLSSFSHVVTTKLNNENYFLWQVQISAYLRGQDLYSYVDGSSLPPPKFLFTDSVPKANPDFSSWNRTDQFVLSVLFSSLSESLLGHVLSAKTTRDLWVSLASMFASHSQAKEFQICFQLTNLSKGGQAMTDYFGKVRSLVDSLAATGNTLPDKEVVTYLLNGLGSSYEAFITSVTTRAEAISSHELYQLLLIHESCSAHHNRSITSSLEPSVHLSVAGNRGCGFSRSGRQ
ncbi:hypothetical protein F2P56_001852, partial [Juglans regia]